MSEQHKYKKERVLINSSEKDYNSHQSSGTASEIGYTLRDSSDYYLKRFQDTDRYKTYHNWRPIENARIMMPMGYYEPAGGILTPNYKIYPLLSDFTLYTTYNTKPGYDNVIMHALQKLSTSTEDPRYVQVDLTSKQAAEIIRHGYAISISRDLNTSSSTDYPFAYVGGYYQGPRQSDGSVRIMTEYLIFDFSTEAILQMAVTGTAPAALETIYRGTKYTFKATAVDPYLTASAMNLTNGGFVIYDNAGEEVKRMTGEIAADGSFTAVIDTSDLADGSYTYKACAVHDSLTGLFQEDCGWSTAKRFTVKTGTTLKFDSVTPGSGSNIYGTKANDITFKFKQNKSSSKSPDISIASAQIEGYGLGTSTNFAYKYDGTSFTVTIPMLSLREGIVQLRASGTDTIGGTWDTNDSTIEFNVQYPTLSVKSVFPQSGAEIDKNSAFTFKAEFSQPAESIGGDAIRISAASMIFRETGSIVETEVASTKTSLSNHIYYVEAAVPANTFDEKQYEYKFRATDTRGRVTESSWNSFRAKNLSLNFASLSPESGARLDRNSDNYFQATLALNAEVAGMTLTVSSATLVYRKKGKTSTTSVTGTVSGMSVMATISAGKLDNDDYEYRWSVTDSKGKTVTSGWLEITTKDAIPVTTAYSPNGILMSDKLPITFRWIHDTATGSAQTEAELYRSPDGAVWTRFARIESAETSYTVDAGTFSNGEWLWRVRSANLDGVFGEYSEPAKFTVIGSPAAPIITVTNTVGRAAVKWQSDEQEAYEITLDHRLPVMYRGASKTWISPEYLPDGAHTISVRVQNKYGLWSAPGIAIITATHTEGAAIIADAESERSVQLTWSSSGYDYYIVYRDEKPICKTQLGFYEDRYSIGECVYQIRGCYNNSYNYGLSAELRITCDPPSPCICEVGGEWLDLQLCDTQHRAYKVSRAASIQRLRLAGRAYPTPVSSMARTLAISLDFAIPQGEPKKQIKALLGKIACLKIPDGEMVIGPVTALDTSYEEFYSVWSVSVEQSDFDDEVSLDD